MSETAVNKWDELEQLREYFLSERDATLDRLIEILEESTEFERGREAGYIMAIDEVLNYVRNRLKYGE